MAECERIGLPFAPIVKPHELFDDVHLNESRGLLNVNLPDGRQTKVPALPMTIGGHRTQIRHDLPRIGQHSREILSEAGFREDEIEFMIKTGAILAED